AWFRFPNGTLVRQKKVYFIIQNGEKQEVPRFVAQARGINLSTAISVSSGELSDYPSGKLYGPADNTVIVVDGKYYVFLDNTKHPASAFVISQRGLSTANAIEVKATDAKLFPDGSQLTPSEGTVLKGDNSTAIYLVEGGTLKLFTPFTFAQRKAASKVQTIPEVELETYPKQGFVVP